MAKGIGKVAAGPAARRCIVLLVILPCMLVGLAGCREQYHWRQKLTVTVATPAGERSGSSVVEVTALFGQLPLSGNEVDYEVNGEAAVVEVAAGKVLFALVDNAEELVANAFRDRLPKSRTEWLPLVSGLAGKQPVPRDHHPTLVTFENLDDPRSIRILDPADLARDLGAGFTLAGMTIEIVDEEPTTGRVASFLGWMNWSDEKWSASSSDGSEPMKVHQKDGMIRAIPRSELFR